MRKLISDRQFFILTMTLALIGITVFASATLGLLARENASVPRNILLQTGLGFGMGLVALAVLRVVPFSFLRKAAPWLYVASLILTALVFTPLGAYANGATRWIDIGFTTVQPAEFLKIGVVLMLAWWFAPHARTLASPKVGLLPFMLILAPAVLLLLLQPNTSTTILILTTGTMMYIIAGARWRDIGILFLIGIIGLGIVAAERDYVRARITTFLSSTEDQQGAGYQIKQSLIAIGSGGFSGKGLGQGVEKFNYLPEPSGDSVFAVFAEEMGFIGSMLLLTLFVLLAARGFVIAGQASDLFGGLVAFGLSFLIIFQAFVNMGAMLELIPLTGLPLPFVSHGGTALLTTLAMCGIILNVASGRKAS